MNNTAMVQYIMQQAVVQELEMIAIVLGLNIED